MSTNLEPPARDFASERVFYSRRGVTVTEHYFVAGRRHYRLVELSTIERHRGSSHPGVVLGLLIAALDALILAPLAMLSGLWGGRVLAALAPLVPCAVALYCAKRWPAAFELHAEYRGNAVTLLRTRDEQEFGQVTRALLRALEARQRTGPA
jgi:hypothetical protein